MEEKFELKVIDNEDYEDVLTIGEIVFAEAYLSVGYYKISKKEISCWGFAWLDENRFEKIG